MAKKIGDVYIDSELNQRKLTDKLSTVGSKIRSFASNAVRTLWRLKWAFLAISGAITNMVRLFMKQERAERGLFAAIRLSGQKADEWMPQLKKIAEQMEKIAVYEDKMIYDAMTYATNMGVAAENLQDVLQKAIGLAQLKGGTLDLKDAVQQVVLATKGIWPQLDRSIPLLRTAKTEQAKWAKFVELTSTGFKEAQADVDTTWGKMQRLSNVLEKLQAALASKLVPTLTKITDLLTKAAANADALAERMAMIVNLGWTKAFYLPPGQFKRWIKEHGDIPPLVKAKPGGGGGQGGGILAPFEKAWGKMQSVVSKLGSLMSGQRPIVPGVKPPAPPKPSERALVGVAELWSQIVGAKSTQEDLLQKIADNTETIADQTEDIGGEAAAVMGA